MLKNFEPGSKLEIALYLGTGPRESADAFSAPTRATPTRGTRANKAENARKVYENMNARGLFLSGNPPLYHVLAPFMRVGARVHAAGGSPCKSSSRAEWRAFPSGNIPPFDVRSHFASANDITGIGVIRRIPTGISTSSFTTFGPIRRNTSCTPDLSHSADGAPSRRKLASTDDS